MKYKQLKALNEDNAVEKFGKRWIQLIDIIIDYFQVQSKNNFAGSSGKKMNVARMSEFLKKIYNGDLNKLHTSTVNEIVERGGSIKIEPGDYKFIKQELLNVGVKEEKVKEFEKEIDKEYYTY